MLKKINPLITPELMKILMEMGHTDEIVFSDRNFPAVSHAQRLVRYPGVGIQELLRAVLEYFPIDYATDTPAVVMRIPADSDYTGNIQGEYKALLDEFHEKPVQFEQLDRWDFYDRAGRAFAVVATGETARFANLILRKGIVR
ncbi:MULTISPECIES: RbsD/FucU family protein [Anaerotruncus]|jgi:L-fucose mutarotase|uniref:RbsD/FucU family protein n=1 Tax=Anaerotruncus TaxID=244127 RepID=UPI0008338A9F|nr:MULTISPECIES: RbsD/FucU domain-containing protein [Anaerotruncus]RGX54881.1 fucose isomerase [Anaerotruncus sp. AF02-27]